jgi:hypothetical protein
MFVREGAKVVVADMLGTAHRFQHDIRAHLSRRPSYWPHRNTDL